MDKGFTLIELLVVILMISLATAVLLSPESKTHNEAIQENELVIDGDEFTH